MIEYYKKIGDNKMEAYYLEKNMRLKDSLGRINQSALITQNKIDKKALLTQKKDNPLFYLLVPIVLLVLLSLIVIYFYRKKQHKKYISPKLPDRNTDLQGDTSDGDNLLLLLEMVKRNDKHLLAVFQNVFPYLYKRLLEFPELTPLDLEMCVYLKLNIQTKDIATYMRSSINSVDSRKYRLRKKLNIPQNTNLYVWINKL
ncbi:helix-turn-helix transcriptional regulator [Chryseobacterium shigense]|uniref:DNA-binding CsgD family transcriptional regulator n=1 Tax=Chryseobacterium shigense TaxID=297244 RepID=A0A841N697_9FLAO|nr:hypothetical protein [Chryseobacterium shigense]MBB6372616.1 DNA-binding CsgD family transcriptional regulator [Chryseobacterium shigense]